MHWPEELIVGGVSKNRTRHITKAKALQTVVQLMGERELYEHYFGSYKIHYIGWSIEKAGEILRAWQKKFSNEVGFCLFAAEKCPAFRLEIDRNSGEKCSKSHGS
jgi:patched 1 protein